MITPMNETLDLHSMTQLQMRQLVQQLMGTVQEQSRLAEQQSRLVAQQASDLQHKQALLDKLTYEMALLKRLKFAAKTEALNTHQRSLLEDALEEDLQAVGEEIAQMRPGVAPTARLQPKRQPLPAQLPRQEFKHEPAVTQCCGQPMRRIGEDVAEKLDYTPGVFTVHRHVRGKWVCACCQMLQPVSKRNGKTHRAYLWAYSPGRHEDTKAVVYDFCESRAGKHAVAFLQGWSGTLLVDDFAGYKQLMGVAIQEAGCWAHARRKFFDLHANNKSLIAYQALEQIGQLYELERQAQHMDGPNRLRLRQDESAKIILKLHAWLLAQRGKVPEGSATARAIDYSLRRWTALTQFLSNGQLPIDNNWIENQMRPIALGRKNWLFAGSFRAGQRAAAVMSLIQSAKLNGHDPHAYLKDVMEKLPTWPNSRIEELLPHRWQQGAKIRG